MTHQKILSLVRDIVVAYVATNVVAAQDVPQLIKAVHASLSRIDKLTTIVFVQQARPPVMTIQASIAPESVGCLECGKRFKSIKLHLSKHALTPDQYRAKWSLPASYPMVSAKYSAARSKIARSTGLGYSRWQK